MTWLLEDPLPILVMGAALAIALVTGFIKTGHKGLLYALAATVVLVIALLALENYVVTDREEVEDVLFEIAEAVERNDIDAAIEHVSPEAPGLERANQELRRIQFQEVKIKPNLEIDVFPERAPPEAVAKFNVVVVANVGLGGMEHYPRYVEATFVKERDDWVVHDYSHHEPTRGMKINPP